MFNVKAIVNKVGVYKYNQFMFAYRFADNDTRNIKTRIRFLETNPQVISAICSCNLISMLIRPYLLKLYYRWELQEVKRMIPNIDDFPQEKLKIESLLQTNDINESLGVGKYALKFWYKWLKFTRICNRIF